MRYESIRFLRGLAAALVVIYHACEYVRLHTTPPSGLSFEFGAIGVDLFFVISGFVMMAAITPNKIQVTGPNDAAYFFAKRLVRIVPMYWLSTLLLYTIYTFFRSKFQNLIIVDHDVIDSLLFIPIISASGNLSPVVNQGWTLHHELFFYSIISVLITLNTAKRAEILLPIAVAIIYTSIALFLPENQFVVMGSGMNLEFGMGCLLSLAINIKIQKKQYHIITTIALLAVLAAIMLDYSSDRTLARALTWGVTSTLVTYTALRLDHRFQGPAASIGGLIGDASYSIYLFHGISFSAAALLINRVWPTIPDLAYITALTLSSFVGGYVVYTIIENPTQRWLTAKINSFRATRLRASSH